MTWYWWIALVFGWMAFGVAVLSLNLYLLARLKGKEAPADDEIDSIILALAIFLWPITLWGTGVMFARGFGKVGKEHYNQDRGQSS